jgi:hypothetical protein
MTTDSRPAITLTYTVNPPSGVETATPTTDTLTFTSDAYDSTAVRQAQAKLNEVLTVWKDAIGDREKSKEDPGVIGYGQGKASKMMRGKEDSSSSEDDEDGEE